MAKKVVIQEGRGGKFDEICERLARDLKASAVVLVVVGGQRGTGMSVSVDPNGGHASLTVGGDELAAILFEVAERIAAGAGPAGIRSSFGDPHES